MRACISGNYCRIHSRIKNQAARILIIVIVSDVVSECTVHLWYGKYRPACVDILALRKEKFTLWEKTHCKMALEERPKSAVRRILISEQVRACCSIQVINKLDYQRANKLQPYKFSKCADQLENLCILFIMCSTRRSQRCKLGARLRQKRAQYVHDCLYYFLSWNRARDMMAIL